MVADDQRLTVRARLRDRIGRDDPIAADAVLDEGGVAVVRQPLDHDPGGEIAAPPAGALTTI